MESQLRDAKGRTGDIPSTLKEQIVIEHTPLIRYIVNRFAVRLPSHIDLDDLHNTGVIGPADGDIQIKLFGRAGAERTRADIEKLAAAGVDQVSVWLTQSDGTGVLDELDDLARALRPKET